MAVERTGFFVVFRGVVATFFYSDHFPIWYLISVA